MQAAVSNKLPVNMLECEQDRAREIGVLRTMFGESYPDMVRVVCVGQDIPTLLEDPKNPDWAGFSVEFCGGTHLSNSSQIQDFLITREESVAKGIRRIEAVTGQYAETARDAFRELSEMFQAAVELPPAEKLAELKALEARALKTTLSAGNRDEFNGMIAAERKKLLAYEKEQQKLKNDKAVKDAEELANKLVGGTQRATVLELDGDKTILQNVIKAFQKIAPEIAIMTVGKNESANTLTVICETPKDLLEALPSNEWCNAAVEVAGGKGGGKPNRAQGAAKEACSQAEAVCEAAVMFANNKLN